MPRFVVVSDSQNTLEVVTVDRPLAVNKVRGWTDKKVLGEIHTIHAEGKMWT